MGMTGLVILNDALVAIVVAVIAGLLAWFIASSMSRRELERTRARRLSQPYRMPELTADVVEREMTIFVPLTHLDDPALMDRVEDGRGVRTGM
jgi:flagellar basal body-associated protein FliL